MSGQTQAVSSPKGQLPLKTATARAGESVIAIYIAMADIADGDLVTAITPGFNFKIIKLDWVQGTAVTTAAKLSTLNAEIGTTNVTGGTVALTSAACTPRGKVVAGAAITAANTGTSTDTISIEASSTTTFIEGDGHILLTLQNTDTVDALDTLIDVLAGNG